MSVPRLAVRDLGGDGATLVLVHGFTGSSEDFADVAPQMTDLRRVVLMDQLGHGESPRAAAYTYEALSEALAAAILRLGVPVDLLGHSLGGRVALQVAIARPDVLRSLILMDTWADAPDRGEAGDVFAESLAGGASMATALERYDEAKPEGEEALIVARLGEDGNRVRLERNAERMDPAALVQLAPLVLLDTSNLLESARTLSCPVTVLVGERDTPFFRPSQRLAAHIPGAHLVAIAGAFHSPQLTHPDDWVAAVRCHLRRVDSLFEETA